MADSDHDAYLAGLTLVARREFSEAQLRGRLLRKGHDLDAVERALARLKRERALDDARVAEAIVRAEAARHGRGRLRASQRLKSAGIAPAAARRALDQVYADIDPDALLARAITRKLGPRPDLSDRRERARLYRHLVGQGFEPDRVLAALRRLGLDDDDG